MRTRIQLVRVQQRCRSPKVARYDSHLCHPAHRQPGAWFAHVWVALPGEIPPLRRLIHGEGQTPRVEVRPWYRHSLDTDLVRLMNQWPWTSLMDVGLDDWDVGVRAFNYRDVWKELTRRRVPRVQRGVTRGLS